jgi:hypothetical protein
VAGDTIQKGELLTFRFFEQNILSDANPPGTEKVDPTQTVDGIALEFDGIGTSEDLIIILDLKDSVTQQEITRAVLVDNGDIFKVCAVLY